jgi:membrane protease YdiL (CAAX protease family)
LFFTIIPSVGGLYLFDFLGGPTVDWSGLQPLYTVVPGMIMLIILAGFGEEFGWRGFALPRLQTRYNALVSSIIVGTLWSIWHIPLYFLEGSLQYAFRMDAGLIPVILGYTVWLIAWSIQYTWLFNNTKGSVLLAAVFHGAGNAWMSGYIDVYRGYWNGILAHAAVSVVISIIIVLVAGPANLSRKNERDMLKLEEE